MKQTVDCHRTQYGLLLALEMGPERWVRTSTVSQTFYTKSTSWVRNYARTLLLYIWVCQLSQNEISTSSTTTAVVPCWDLRVLVRSVCPSMTDAMIYLVCTYTNKVHNATAIVGEQ